MNKEELTKEDILNITSGIIDTMLDFSENSKKEIENLQQENKELKDLLEKRKISANDILYKNAELTTKINTALNFIDQVLMYHLQPFDYKQVDEDINKLIGILTGDGKK